MVDVNAMSDGFTPSEFWQGIIDSSPRETYFGFGNKSTGPSSVGWGSSGGQNKRRYFQNQFQPIFDEFTGQVSRNLMQGQGTTQQPSFQDFLGGMSFDERFASIAPSMRGGNRGRFAPQAAFRF
tara:strand:- start:23 stop:394 length:372 start_codon:yes stop_codon:yes gene_type:complete